MKWFSLGLSVFVMLGLVAPVSIAEAPDLGWTTKARVINVVDGDTVDVEIRRVVRVRLLDCWAPESRTTDLAEKARGLAAKRYLKNLIDGEDVVLHIPTDGSDNVASILTLNRVLGKLFIDGSDVSEVVVNAGHATKTKTGN